MVLDVANAAPLPEAKPNDVGNGFWPGWTVTSLSGAYTNCCNQVEMSLALQS
jgi:hypothetical protein